MPLQAACQTSSTKKLTSSTRVGNDLDGGLLHVVWNWNSKELEDGWRDLHEMHVGEARATQIGLWIIVDEHTHLSMVSFVRTGIIFENM